MPLPRTIRPGTVADVPFMREMLFEAFFWNPDAPRPPFEDFARDPTFTRLVEGWGRPGDAACVAEDAAGRPVGAAWYRLFTPEDHSYGYIDDATPEISVAVHPAARGNGVGMALLRALMDRARADGVGRLSLSVIPENPARRLYERLRFRKVGIVGEAWTMLAAVDSAAGGSQADIPPALG